MHIRGQTPSGFLDLSWIPCPASVEEGLGEGRGWFCRRLVMEEGVSSVGFQDIGEEL